VCRIPDRGAPETLVTTGLRRVCITGGAGFLGSHLAERLIAADVEVAIVDRARRHKRADNASRDPRIRVVEGDVLDPATIEDAVDGCDWVFHLQANADVRTGLEHPRRDLEQSTLATSNVLEAMRARGVARIMFASSAAVYGEPGVVPTPEDAPFPLQTSLYGASKLAGEGLLAAYANGYGFTALICRFVSLLGERYSHGHLLDFHRALARDPEHLRVLGDGRQRKSYMYVGDAVAAILTAAEAHRREPGVHIYNVGTDETATVADSAALVAEHLSLAPAIEYAGGRRGWTGDSPLLQLDTARIRGLGWRPRLTIREAAVRTLEWLDTRGDP
jgi:UDP-glucose 4-epimerase